MASDKFGNNPVAPLYNATGRNPRDVDMGTPGKGLGSVGSSGAGGKDFGISNQPPKKADLGSSLISPLNPYNMLYGNPMGGRRRGGGGGGEVEYDIDAMERIAKAQTPGVVQFGDANTGTINDYSVNKRAVGSSVDVNGDMNIANKQTQNLTTTPGSSPSLKPKMERTAEEKRASQDKAKATRAKNKELNPSGYGRKNTNRPERAPSPIARKRGVSKANTSTGNIEMTQSMGNLKNKMSVGGNF